MQLAWPVFGWYRAGVLQGNGLLAPPAGHALPAGQRTGAAMKPAQLNPAGQDWHSARGWPMNPVPGADAASLAKPSCGAPMAKNEPSLLVSRLKPCSVATPGKVVLDDVA